MSEEHESTAEVASLQKLRATLEMVRQTTEKLHADLESATRNHKAIATESEKALSVFKQL